MFTLDSFSFGVPGRLSSPIPDNILLSLLNAFWSMPDAVAIFCVAVCFVWALVNVLSNVPLVFCLPDGLEAMLSVEPWIVVWLRPPRLRFELICVSEESSLVCDSVSLFLSSEIRNCYKK